MEPAILFPKISFPDIKISRANPNTRSRRRRLHKKAKIRSLKAGFNGDEDLKMGPYSSEQFDAPPPSQVDSIAAELVLKQVDDDTTIKMMPFSSNQLSDAPPPPISDITTDRETILQSGKVLPEKKRIRLASTELNKNSYYLRCGRKW